MMWYYNYSPGRNGGKVSLFMVEITTKLKILENYPNVRKAMINVLFRHASRCFMLKFRRYQNFQNNTPKHIKNLDEFHYWWNNSKVSIWNVLIYSVARTFKSDPIKNKLLKILPGLQKFKYWVLMFQECLLTKKEIAVL